MTPAGAVDDQLNWVFATADEMETVWVVSPLQIVCGVGRTMDGVGLTKMAYTVSGPGQLLAERDMVKLIQPVVSAGLSSVKDGIRAVVPFGLNPVMPLGDSADQPIEDPVTVEVNRTDCEGRFSQTVWDRGLLFIRGVGLTVTV